MWDSIRPFHLYREIYRPVNFVIEQNSAPSAGVGHTVLGFPFSSSDYTETIREVTTVALSNHNSWSEDITMILSLFHSEMYLWGGLYSLAISREIAKLLFIHCDLWSKNHTLCGGSWFTATSSITSYNNYCARTVEATFLTKSDRNLPIKLIWIFLLRLDSQIALCDVW